MMKVLVTGGTGYVGGRIGLGLSKLPDFFLRIGSRGLSAPNWLTQGELVTLRMDNDDEVRSACQGIDCIIHLAALNEIESAADPQQALLVNSLGTLKLLRAAEMSGVKRFVYFSTAHVYGAPLTGVIKETLLPRPIHPYAITHRVAEDFVLAAHHQRSIEGIVVRLSNSLGPPADMLANRWTLISNDLCRQAVVDKKLVLRSSGLQQRDFVALSDVAMAVNHLLHLPALALGDGLFNLGGKCVLPIIGLAELIAKRSEVVLGYSPSIIRPEPKTGEISPILDYCTDKLTSTGFSLQGSIDDEIDSTLKFCYEAFGRTQ